MRNFKYGICLVLMVSLFSCNTAPEMTDDDVIVTVHQRNLYYSDVVAAIPSYFTAEDSIEVAENFINSWIEKELLYHYASQRLRDTTKIHQKIQDYRRELFRYEMEKQILKSNFDSSISVSEIRNYYDTHLGDYKLEELAVKAHYLIMDVEVASYYYELDKVRRSFPGKMDLLYDAEKRSNVSVVEHTDWIYFSDLLEEIKASMTAEIRNGLNLGYFMSEDDENRYIVKINERKLPGDTIPISLIYNDVEKVLLSHRQNELLDKFINDLKQDAKSKHSIVYNEN